jgi:hypothetical protein
MTPETFRDLLDHELYDAPPAAPYDPGPGRRRLRRRRLAAGTAALALLAAAGTGAALATGGDPAPAPVATDPGRDLLAECRAVPQKIWAAGADVFGDGATRVVTSTSSGPAPIAVLEASDGDWAVCRLGSTPLVLTYAAGSREPEPVVGRGCGDAPWDEADACRTVRLSVADRVPAGVASARIEFLGDVREVPVVEGYLLADLVEPVPDGRTYAAWVGDPPAVGLDGARVTYLDAAGDVVTAAR